jgi:hypothetical protein
MTERVSARTRVAAWALKHGYAIALAAIVAASLAFRLHVSHECSLWLDEAATARDAYADWPALLRGPEREHPPLMFWLVRLATALLGRGDTAVRAVSLAFGCVVLVAVYLLCLELRFSANRGLVAAASLALTPFFIRHATEARQYAMAGAFVTLATVYALRLLDKPPSDVAERVGQSRLRSLIGFGVCTVAASATHFFALAYALALWAAVAAGQVRLLDLRPLPVRGRASMLAAIGAPLVLLALVSVRLASVVRWYSTHSLGGRAHHHLSALVIWQNFSFAARPRWPIPIEAAISAGGLVFIALRRRDLGGLIPLLLAFAPVGVGRLVSSGHALAPRYLWPSFVFYHLGEVAAVFAVLDLVAWGARRIGGPAPRLAALAWLILLVPLNLRLREYPDGYGAGQVNYRGLKAYFEGPRGKDTALVVFVGYAGLSIMGTQYPVPMLMSLESFQRIPGIDRYLVAEFHSTDPHLMGEFRPLIARHFGLSPGQWRALRLVRLPGTRFQAPVRARLVVLDENGRARTDERRPRRAAPPPAAEAESSAPSDAVDGEEELR